MYASRRGRGLSWRSLAGGLVSAALVVAYRRARAAYSLRGRTVVITGGARGLGLVLARELARRGARLALVARDEVTLANAHRELEAAGAEVLAVPCDVRDEAQVAQMVAAVRATFGAIDVLINDAGEIEVGPLETMTREDFTRSMDTMFWGAWNTTMAVLPEMRERRSGRIANIASIGGLVPIPHLAPYTASKHALVGLSSALRTELAQDGVLVTTVCPWLMRTGSPRNASFKGQHRLEHAWFAVGDALPGLSLPAERAARRIADAVERGTPMLVLGAFARLSQLAHALVPNLFQRAMSVVARMLPAPGGIGQERALGRESTSAVAPSLLTALGDRAARRNNEEDWSPHR